MPNTFDKFKFNITEHLCVLSTGARGWTKELNIVSWNDGEPKYDLRDWAPNHERMGKGITLNEEDIVALKKFLDSRFA